MTDEPSAAHAHIGYGPELSPDGPSAYDTLVDVVTVPVGPYVPVVPDSDPDRDHTYVWVCTEPIGECEYA